MVIGFRPLTGTLLSKTRWLDTHKQNHQSSFRPLTGTLLSKRDIQHWAAQKEQGFRPLTGTLLSKSKTTLDVKRTYGFPSPHGDSLI